METKYRKANSGDLQLFFNWANDPVVRNNSYNSHYITLEEHTNWFHKKIQDKNTLFYIVEIDNESAGMIRFDISEKHTIINIIIDKNFRGKKMAPIFLLDCCKYYFEENSKPLLAYIKSNNLASIQAFKKANFAFLKLEIVNNIESQIFKKEND